ncbi:UNVERIFIED_CONTAM: hypothetical protein K2H54_006529 [Gekko kuhli]
MEGGFTPLLLSSHEMWGTAGCVLGHCHHSASENHAQCAGPSAADLQSLLGRRVTLELSSLRAERLKDQPGGNTPGTALRRCVRHVSGCCRVKWAHAQIKKPLHLRALKAGFWQNPVFSFSVELEVVARDQGRVCTSVPSMFPYVLMFSKLS